MAMAKTRRSWKKVRQKAGLPWTSHRPPPDTPKERDEKDKAIREFQRKRGKPTNGRS